MGFNFLGSVLLRFQHTSISIDLICPKCLRLFKLEIFGIYFSIPYYNSVSLVCYTLAYKYARRMLKIVSSPNEREVSAMEVVCVSARC